MMGVVFAWLDATAQNITLFLGARENNSIAHTAGLNFNRNKRTMFLTSTTSAPILPIWQHIRVRKLLFYCHSNLLLSMELCPLNWIECIQHLCANVISLPHFVGMKTCQWLRNPIQLTINWIYVYYIGIYIWDIYLRELSRFHHSRIYLHTRPFSQLHKHFYLDGMKYISSRDFIISLSRIMYFIQDLSIHQFYLKILGKRGHFTILVYP